MHVQRFSYDRHLRSRARRRLVAGTIRTYVFSRAIERAIHLKKSLHTLAVFSGQFDIESALIDALREQLAYMPTGIIDRLALHHWCTAICLIVLQQGGAGSIDLNLEWNAEFTTISEHHPVCTW